MSNIVEQMVSNAMWGGSGGSVYTCIAPAGVVCTWSPDEYPAYWEKV